MMILSIIVGTVLLSNQFVNANPTPISAALSSPEVSMGTTILAVAYRDGVIVGADTRTSVSGYVSNRYATKISFILDKDMDVDIVQPPSSWQYQSSLYDQDDDNNYNNGHHSKYQSQPSASTCCLCCSGSAADSQHLADKVRNQLLSRRLLHSCSSTISDATHVLKQLILQNSQLHSSIICAGYDHIQNKGLIYSINLGGAWMEHDKWACSGSGSTYILGYLDTNTCGEDTTSWSEEEAIALVERAIRLAINWDGSSGGFVRIFVINKDGRTPILRMPEDISTTSSGSTRARGNKSPFAYRDLPKFAKPKRSYVKNDTA